jgi:hypothetical protein
MFLFLSCLFNCEHKKKFNMSISFSVKQKLLFPYRDFILTFVHYFYMFIFTEQENFMNKNESG